MRQNSVASSRHGSVDANANAALAKMGYKAELPRNLSMFSVLGLSFAIMAVPFGLSTTFYVRWDCALETHNWLISERLPLPMDNP